MREKDFTVRRFRFGTRAFPGHGIARNLEDDRPFGWDTVYYDHMLGYWASGPYGESKSLTKEEGRACMRGMACPI